MFRSLVEAVNLQCTMDLVFHFVNSMLEVFPETDCPGPSWHWSSVY
jgi:hypothetical protein